MLRDLKVLYSTGTVTGLTDRQLLERFQTAVRDGDRPAAEVALSAVVDRHAAMVWNVCRSLVRDVHDAEDAFQATCLILVRRAGTLRAAETLGPWLHLVAYRTALGVRMSAARRRAAVLRSEPSERARFAGGDSGNAGAIHNELRAALHAEIAGLPERFRAVLTLCDLEGQSYLEAARRLAIPLGTVQSRLARARARLRRGLARRGIDGNDLMPASGEKVFGLLLAASSPPALIRRSCHLGVLVACDPSHWRASVAGPVQAVAARGLRAMWPVGLGRIAAAGLGGLLVGGALLHADSWSGQDGTPPRQGSSPLAKPQQPVAARIELPTPRRLAVVAGQGKILMYLLDEKRRRVPIHPEKRDSPFREDERAIRWAVITGVIDHREMLRALDVADRKLPRPVEELYMRVDQERQVLQKDGNWSQWALVDPAPTLEVLDNLPAIEAERVAEPLRVDGLVDPLPFLISGAWRGVDVEEFLSPERTRRDDRPAAGTAPQEAPGERAPIVNPRAPRIPGLRTTRELAPVLMIRSLDFSVEPGRSYRYRLRVVMRNPDATKTRAKTKQTAWSEPTDVVTVPSR